jgi:hypothetical protein
MCAAGHGVALMITLGVGPLFASGALEQILADWAEERFPPYAYHLSRHLPPAKVRAFVDFVLAAVEERRAVDAVGCLLKAPPEPFHRASRRDHRIPRPPSLPRSGAPPHFIGRWYRRRTRRGWSAGRMRIYSPVRA